MSNCLTARTKSAVVAQPARAPMMGGVLQRKCACGAAPGMDGACAACRAKRLQRQSAAQPEPTSVPPIVHEVLRAPGRPLDAATRALMEPRLGHVFSGVRVHTDAKAAESARAVNALAYTVGQDVVFSDQQFAPDSAQGNELLGHELVHVIQQEGLSGPPATIDPDPLLEQEARDMSAHWVGAIPVRKATTARLSSLQRQPRDGTVARLRPNQRLEYRPSIGPPCACLVFIHNNERNARGAAEALHDQCRYNLAIIGPGTGRDVPIRGSRGQIDPNELFPSNIQEECTRDAAACAAYEASHNDLRAMQIQFFFTIKRCSRDFGIPTVALHNNALNDTRSFLRGTTSAGRLSLRGDFSRASGDPVTSLAELRRRLGRHTGILDRSRSTNIFRWCRLPEISRCHVGDPDHPDHVIWVTTAQDFETLQAGGNNVVLQEGVSTAADSESETDLSTLFVRLGAGARFINIETPISPESAAARSSNLSFIQSVLADLGLECCEPVGDFPMPSPTERFA